MRYMKLIGITLIVFACLFSSLSVWAKEDYPNKPIQVIIPFPAGGPVDLMGRIIGEKMAEYLGQQVVIVNKPGGGTAVAWGYVAGSKPDGYTLFGYPAMLLVVTPLTMPTLPLKMTDFIPIGRMVNFNFIIVVNKDLPVKTLQDLVTYVKKNPGTLSYGGSTYGSGQHLIGELLKQNNELDLQFIPFAGENPAITALLGSHIQVGVFTIFQSSHVKSNSVRGLAVLSAKRDPLLPGVPTALEQGFPDLVVSAGYTLLLSPARTPVPVVKRLESALEKALQDKSVREKLEKIELTVDFLNSEGTQTFLENEVKIWSPVLKKANIIIK
jgi:tripartite-type tricarboxylate transporter receptor subunit TctC